LNAGNNWAIDEFLQWLAVLKVYGNEAWILPLVALAILVTKGSRWAAPVHFVLLLLLLVYAVQYRMHWNSWVAVPILAFAIASDLTRDFWYRLFGDFWGPVFGRRQRIAGDATPRLPATRQQKWKRYSLALLAVQLAVVVAAFIYLDASGDVWAIAAGVAGCGLLLAVLPGWRALAETFFRRELRHDPRLGRYLDWVRWTRMRTPKDRRSLLAENWIARVRRHAEPGGYRLLLARALVRPRRMTTIESRFVYQNLARAREQAWQELQASLHGDGLDTRQGETQAIAALSEILATRRGQTALLNWLSMTEALAECVAFANDQPSDTTPAASFESVQQESASRSKIEAPASRSDRAAQASANKPQYSSLSFVRRAGERLRAYVMAAKQAAASERPRWLMAAEFLSHAGEVEQEIMLDLIREAHAHQGEASTWLKDQLAAHRGCAIRYFDLSACCIENHLEPGTGIPKRPLGERWNRYVGHRTTSWGPRPDEESLWRMVLALRYQVLDTLSAQRDGRLPSARRMVSLLRGDLGSTPPVPLLAAALSRDAAETSLWLASQQGDPSSRWVFDDRRLWADRFRQAEYWRARLHGGDLGQGEIVAVTESAIRRVVHLWGLAVEQDLDFLRRGTEIWRDRLETAADFFIYAGSLRAKRLAALSERHAQSTAPLEQIVELV
jgi:hypothetical protein